MTYEYRMSSDAVYYKFYIHGSMLRESNLIIVQQDTTVLSLLCFSKQLYMFRC